MRLRCGSPVHLISRAEAEQRRALDCCAMTPRTRGLLSAVGSSRANVTGRICADVDPAAQSGHQHARLRLVQIRDPQVRAGCAASGGVEFDAGHASASVERRGPQGQALAFVDAGDHPFAGQETAAPCKYAGLARPRRQKRAQPRDSTQLQPISAIQIGSALMPRYSQKGTLTALQINALVFNTRSHARGCSGSHTQ